MGFPASKDDLFLDEATQPFAFSEDVAVVFDDMADRSIPLYRQVVQCAVKVARDYYQPGTMLYDIGCSTGTTSLAILEESGLTQVKIGGIDPSAAMLTQFSKKIAGHARATQVSMYHSSIENFMLRPTSVVILNYTLQFIDPDIRPLVLGNIRQAMVPGAVMLFSEKILMTGEEEFFDSLYYDFKQRNGYSWAEIENKRNALAGVLRPKTLSENKNLLTQAGFTKITPIFQAYQFVTFLCFA